MHGMDAISLEMFGLTSVILRWVIARRSMTNLSE